MFSLAIIILSSSLCTAEIIGARKAASARLLTSSHPNASGLSPAVSQNTQARTLMKSGSSDIQNWGHNEEDDSDGWDDEGDEEYDKAMESLQLTSSINKNVLKVR